MYWSKKKWRKRKKKEEEEEETRVGAPVKRNIVHAPARRNIWLLSVYTLGRVRFLLWYRRLLHLFSFLVLSLLFPSLLPPSSSLSLSLTLSFAFSFFAASWLRKPTINPRRQLGISWRHDFTKPYRSPFLRSVATTGIYVFLIHLWLSCKSFMSLFWMLFHLGWLLGTFNGSCTVNPLNFF